MTDYVLAKNKRVALTRQHNLQIFLPPVPAPPFSSRFILSPFTWSFLFLTHLGRYINVNPRAFLCSPFLDARTNSQSRLRLPLSLLSFLPALSFRLCSSLLLSWPVNLPFFAICEGSGVHSWYDFSMRRVAKRDRYLTYPLYSCPIYLAITLDAGDSIAQLSVNSFPLCVFHRFKSHVNLTQSNLT